MLQSAFIASRKGRLYYYNPADNTLKLAFRFSEAGTLMGLEKRKEFLYVGEKSKLFKLKMKKGLVLSKVFINKKRRSEFHQMSIINNYLYVTATNLNQIWKFDLDLNLCKKFQILPPDENSPVKWGKNYNHLNNIFYYKGSFHVCLNWLTRKQYGPSGVAVLNKKMKEVHRFEYGWETHNYMILEGQEYVVCGSSGRIKTVLHTHKGGLLVNGKLVFEYDPDLYFCKDFSIDKSHIYIVGGGVAKRGDRDIAKGVIFILNRKFDHIKTLEFNKSGELLGCLMPYKDLTKGGWRK